MIFKSLELIRQNLEDYINLQLEAGEEEAVALENIAMFENLREDPDNGAATTVTPKIIISLVNIEEEATLKNNPHFRTKKINGEVDYQNPPVFINLYMLVTANHQVYKEALRKLSLIMQFFQSRKIFTISDAFNPDRPLAAGDIDLEFDNEESISVKLNIELFSMTFEQVNHLWGSLGGKQIPFVLYVVRLVKVEDIAKQKGGRYIQEVHINES
jgi:hypothetical protein